MLTTNDIDSARAVIRGKVHRTPLLPATSIGRQFGAQLYFKCENLQKTGSFKPRGGLNRVAHLSSEEKARGLITVSAGNHAQGVAYAAQREGVKAVVVMPANAPQAKADATRGYGAEVVLFGTTSTILDKAAELQREHGYTYVNPFEDEHLMAGHATIAMEILEDLPEVDVVAVPVGGGALLAGIASAIKLHKPSVRVVGVEPALCPAMQLALKAGHPERVSRSGSIADGLMSPFVGALPLSVVQRYVDELVSVDDEEIANAMRWILQRSKLLVEGAGATATAAFLSGKAKVAPGAKVVTLLSGGNLDFARLKMVLG